MARWLFVVLHLLVEGFNARRDARIRFLKAQVEILRRKLGGNRVIPSPDDRARLRVPPENARSVILHALRSARLYRASAALHRRTISMAHSSRRNVN